MTRLADCQELHINPSLLPDELLIVFRFRTQIARHAIRDVRVGEVDIHPAEEVMIHVKAIGMLVLGGDADVFIQVERAAPREVQAFLLVLSHQSVIDAFHRKPGG